jgi:glycosyltransferase involved in cell wall biosynthesis
LNSDHSPIKLTFLVRALDYGGAQRQLISLAKALDQSRFSVCVLTFYSGPLEQELAGSGVQVLSLNKRGRWDIFGFLRRLVSQVRRDRPDVLHGYLDIPNVLTLFLKLFVRTKAVWGLRASTIELEHYDWLHRLASRLEKLFARYADLIIINSAAGLEQHLARGFPPDKLIVIPNGFDTEVFEPDREAGEKLRREWGITEKTKLVGIVGRLDPMKDHQSFLRAAAVVARGTDDVRFLCVGDGPAGYLKDLKTLATDLDLTDRVIWRAATTNMRAVYNALDMLVSSSRAEGLPNVVGEAMACGVPCVVTDVGDSRWLVGDCGIVVPPQDPEALSKAIIHSLEAEGNEANNMARARIVENFSVQRLAGEFEAAIVSLR